MMNALLNTFRNSTLYNTTHSSGTSTHHSTTSSPSPTSTSTNGTTPSAPSSNGPQQNFRYEGEKNDKGLKHGFGTMWYSATTCYKGEWKDDQMHGYGEYLWGDGHKYVGHFENGKQHGKGVYCWPTGGQYNGSWECDKMNGYGTYIRNDGVIYMGMWKDDHQFGMGIKLIPERIAYGPKKEMFRKRKYREVWSADQKLIYHKEIQEYPDVFKVYKRAKFSDIDIITQSDLVDEEGHGSVATTMI